MNEIIDWVSRQIYANRDLIQEHKKLFLAVFLFGMLTGGFSVYAYLKDVAIIAQQHRDLYRDQLAHQKPEGSCDANYLLHYGTNMHDPKLGMWVEVDGSLLQKFKTDFCCIAVVSFQWNMQGDYRDAMILTKSGPHDIENRVMGIASPWGEKFKNKFKPGGTNYSLLLLLKGSSLDKFSTLREAESVGIKVLSTRGGPP